MQNASPFILLDSSASTLPDGIDSITPLEIKTSPQPLKLAIASKDCLAKLADIVPLARELADKIVAAVIAEHTSAGASIACRKACPGNCCKYLILLSVPEAFRLVAEVVQMPLDERTKIIQTTQALAQILAEEFPSPAPGGGSKDSAALRSEIMDWLNSDAYLKLSLPCPFLKERLCTIYPHRPLLCRQWLVKGEPSVCVDAIPKEKLLSLPVNIADALKRLAAQLEESPPEVVALPTVFDWFQANQARYDRSWPAAIIAESFANSL